MIREVRPADLDVVASDFQFKRGCNHQDGANDTLRGVRRWVPGFGGVLTTWERLDGRMVVLDGHQRLATSRRLEAEGHPPIMLLCDVQREADGVTEDHALVLALAANIAAGGETTDPWDVAATVRKRGVSLDDLRDMVPPRRALFRNAEALLRLAEAPFWQAYMHAIPARWAGRVADAFADGAEQAAVLSLLHDAAPLTVTEAEILIEQARRDGFAVTVDNGLLGELVTADPRTALRARVLERALANLRARKAELSTVTTSNRRLRLEALGNRLVTDRNREALEAVKVLSARLRRKAIHHGPVGDMLADAVQVVVGGASLNEAANDLIDRMMADPSILTREDRMG